MSVADLLVVAGFVALFAVGFVVGARTGARSLVRQALSAPAPEVRQAAVRLAVHTGLAPHVKALMQRTRVEEDRRVLATLADVVSAADPTPDDPPLLDELRLWARSYPDARPLPGSGGDRERDLSWVLPVALCNVAAVAGAVVGAGLGGGGLVVAGSAIFAGGVLVVYALRATPGARSGGGERGWWVGAARRPRPVPEPPHPR
ncbi:MAG: hypothetical protein M3Q48_00005, partial [Actinomycetota bacterium]|nr:hypothetical protein [Actinomycetota bacterium]